MRSLFCVLGDPVAHSRSPALMSRAFALLGVDAAYAPCRVLAEELPEAVRGLHALGARGFNVTVPHKTRVLELCDRLAPEAARIGAVNRMGPRCGAGPRGPGEPPLGPEPHREQGPVAGAGPARRRRPR